MTIKNEKGFNLIELVIVIALIGIVGAIAAPNFSRYRDNANLKEAARDIESDIQLSKQRAVAESAGYRIVFDKGANTYTTQKFVDPAWVNVATKTVGKGNAAINISADPTFVSNTVTIQPRGTMNAGTLEIQHTQRQSKAYIIASSMGRVRMMYDLK